MMKSAIGQVRFWADRPSRGHRREEGVLRFRSQISDLSKTEISNSHANCLGRNQVSGDYREGAGGERRDAGPSAVADVSRGSPSDQARDQECGGVDLSGEG